MIARGVIDILDGVVVRGIQGQRNAYAPLQSRLTQSTTPDDIARALHEIFGLRNFYVADLDAIVHKKNPDWDLFALWSSRGWDVWADLGVTGPNSFITWPTIPGMVGVIGTESWEGPPNQMATITHPPLVLSLDTKDGKLWGKAKGDFGTPMDCLEAWTPLGIADLLWMDLGKVGAYGGPTRGNEIEFARRKGRRIHAAGGVRGPEDLIQLQKEGFDGVLIASALHDGRLAAI